MQGTGLIGLLGVDEGVMERAKKCGLGFRVQGLGV